MNSSKESTGLMNSFKGMFSQNIQQQSQEKAQFQSPSKLQKSNFPNSLEESKEENGKVQPGMIGEEQLNQRLKYISESKALQVKAQQKQKLIAILNKIKSLKQEQIIFKVGYADEHHQFGKDIQDIREHFEQKVATQAHRMQCERQILRKQIEAMNARKIEQLSYDKASLTYELQSMNELLNRQQNQAKKKDEDDRSYHSSPNQYNGIMRSQTKEEYSKKQDSIRSYIETEYDQLNQKNDFTKKYFNEEADKIFKSKLDMSLREREMDLREKVIKDQEKKIQQDMKYIEKNGDNMAGEWNKLLIIFILAAMISWIIYK